MTTGQLLLLIIIGVPIAYWAYRLWRLKTSVQRYARYWRKQQTLKGNLTLLALGDSAAQGIGASRPERGYIGLLRHRLENTTGKTVRVVNLSKSGAKALDVLNEQIPEIQKFDADFIVLGVGGNDVLKFDGEQFQKTIAEIMLRLPNKTIVADVPYFMHGTWENNAHQAAKTIRVSAEQNGLSIAHLYASLQCQGWKAMFKNFAADWFHPSNSGHKLWADAFWTALSTSIKKGRSAS